jgi:hypothetical protein
VSAPHLRPRSVPELLDAAVQLTRLHFAAFLQLAAVLAIPSLIISLANAWLVPPAAGRAGMAAFWVFPLALLNTCWYAVAVGAMVTAASEAYVGRPVDVAGALRHALARAASLIGGNLLAYLITAIGFVVAMLFVALAAAVLGQSVGSAGGRTGSLLTLGLFGVAMLVTILAAFAWALAAAARYVNVTAAVVVEGLGATAALGRSRALSRGSAWRIVGLLVLLFVLALVVLVPVLLLLDMILDNAQLAAALGGLAAVPLYPPFACVLALLYYDLRIRKEGFDIELMARELATDPHSANAHPVDPRTADDGFPRPSSAPSAVTPR